MNNLKRNKPLKACLPAQTVANIRKILHENNIVVKEVHHESDFGSMATCSTYIFNEEIKHFCFGTNGKGLSFEYSLASSYAELMERIQSGVITLKKRTFLSPTDRDLQFFNETSKDELLKNEALLPYLFAPDEKIIKRTELLKETSNILMKMLKVNSEKELNDFISENKLLKEDVTCLPFYDVNNESVQYLPYNLIRLYNGTNGLCAGNTREEAIIQGICEIFERYVTKRIYLENLKLPTIPHSYFENEPVYNIIKEIESRGFILKIKDCSLGMNLPVIGLLFIDKNNNKYHFHLGSDPSPITALERCLTETNQGEKAYLSKFFNIDIYNDFFEDDKSNKLRYEELISNFITSTGRWVNSIFEEPEEKFNGFYHPESNSNEEDLKYLINIIKEIGFNYIFIRDMSFLGFPTFQIFIPGMGENFLNHEIITDLFTITENINVFYNIPNASEEEIKKLAEDLDMVYKHNNFPKFNINTYYNFNVLEGIKELTTELFIAMLFFRIKNFAVAAEYINIQIANERKNNNQNVYLLIIRDLLNGIANKKPQKELINLLANIYGPNLVNEIVADFSQNNIFSYNQFPVCFNCENCEIKETCKYIPLLKFQNSLLKKYEMNVPDQKLIKHDFAMLN